MPRAYFDTTVYHHIVKRHIPAAEIDAVQPLIARREVLVYLSPTNVDELIGQWNSDPAPAVERLIVARDLVGFDMMSKQPADLLHDAIRAYATRSDPPPILLPPSVRKRFADYLNGIIRGDPTATRDMPKVITDVARLKDDFKPVMAKGRAQTLTFEEFWAGGAIHWAEALAEQIGLGDECRRRGLEGLLEVRTVRLCVGAALSLVFAQVVGDGVQSRDAHRDDGYVLWHAIHASTADIFVTGDGGFAKRLERVPVDLRITASLTDLLAHP